MIAARSLLPPVMNHSTPSSPEPATPAQRLGRVTPFLYWALAAVVFASDQITKRLVEESFPLHAIRPVVRGLFNLTHTRNTGAAFSLFSDASGPWKTFLLVGVSLALLVGVVWWLWVSRKQPLRWGLGIGLSLLLGGAAGNLVDRIRFGYVVDFLDLHIRHHHWPTFNVADSAITVGAVFLIIDAFQSPSPSR